MVEVAVGAGAVPVGAADEGGAEAGAEGAAVLAEPHGLGALEGQEAVRGDAGEVDAAGHPGRGHVGAVVGLDADAVDGGFVAFGTGSEVEPGGGYLVPGVGLPRLPAAGAQRVEHVAVGPVEQADAVELDRRGGEQFEVGEALVGVVVEDQVEGVVGVAEAERGGALAEGAAFAQAVAVRGGEAPGEDVPARAEREAVGYDAFEPVEGMDPPGAGRERCGVRHRGHPRMSPRLLVVHLREIADAASPLPLVAADGCTGS
ncbi:hypothetical protein ACWV95_24325 [Streptomyces albus]